MRDVLFIFSILSFIVLASGLNITFPTQPFAATNNTYIWIRESSDPQDFFLRKIKIDGDGGPTSPSPPVAVPDLGGQGGMGLIHFNRAGVFQIIAVDTQNPQNKPFFEMLITVQVNSSSTTQPSGGSSNNNNDGDNNNNGGGKGGGSSGQGGNHWSGNGHDNDNHNSHGGDGHGKGGKGNQMNMDPPSNSTGPSSDNSGSARNSSPQKDIPKIVGIVLGCISFMFLVAAILVYLRYRRRRQTNNFQQNMMTRSPGSITPWMEALPIDGMEKKEYLSRNSSYTSNRSGHLRQPQVPLTTYSDPSVPPGLVGLGPSPPSPTRSDSVGTSISQRRPNDLGNGNPRGRNSGTSITTLTLSSSGSRSNRSESASFVQFPVPSLPSRTRTVRQMMIEKEIQEMQGRILSLQTRPQLSDADAMEREEELRQITARVERLQRIHEGPWALGLSDTIPSGLT
ncbi:hypothetical protein VKT23_012431 [Stygiomarasmius scandens]|uniref:Uncharacterized protein n=1 Tax=Marasmiellus scandens TaxID=2682957 RepID=A0ABR1J621_9AGAR